jgi:hypothetical protein
MRHITFRPHCYMCTVLLDSKRCNTGTRRTANNPNNLLLRPQETCCTLVAAYLLRWTGFPRFGMSLRQDSTALAEVTSTSTNISTRFTCHLLRADRLANSSGTVPVNRLSCIRKFPEQRGGANWGIRKHGRSLNTNGHSIYLYLLMLANKPI